MFHYFIRHLSLCLLMGCLTGVWGCAGMMEVMPTPPGVLARVELNGPYDADIPSQEINQIKSASLMQDWAVPYIFMRVGMHFASAGDSIRSIHFLNRARDEFQKRNNVAGEASAVSRKISALIHFGNRRAAYLAIEALDKKWSSAPFNAFVFFNYGYDHLKNGNYAKARRYFEQSLAVTAGESEDPDLLALRRDNEMGYAMTLILADTFPAVAGRLGLADFDAGFYQSVRRHASEGLSHLDRVSVLNGMLRRTNVYHYFPEIVPPNIECDMLNYRGLAAGLSGKATDAVQNIEAAVSMARNANYPLGEADGIFFLNQVYLLDKNHSEGIKAVSALSEIAGRFQMMSYEIWAQMMLAHHYKALSDVNRTMISLDKALTLMEENGSWLMQDRDFRGIVHFKRPEIYEALLELAVGKGDERLAFQTAERSKAAVLADQLSHDITGKTPDVKEAIKQLLFHREQLAEYYQALFSPFGGDAAFRDTVGQIDKARRAAQELSKAVKEKDGALYALIGVAPPTVGDLQGSLDNDTTLFTYYVGQQYLYIWAISQNGFRQARIGMSRRDVERLVSSALSALGSKDKTHADIWAEQIYEAFLKPVIPFVSGERVGFVPHGALYNLPFASMRYVKSYLVDGFTIFTLPYAGLAKQQPVRKPLAAAKMAIIVADARCVEKRESFAAAREELDTVKRVFPRADYFVKDRALKDDWQVYFGTYDAIHLIVDRCYLDEVVDAPSPLGKVRWQQGCPSTRDIFRLRLHGNLTVLSVCGRERMSAIAGAGRPAWTGAWLYAVSPQIVTQLWDVEDKTRAALIGMFYSHLRKSGDAAEALKVAQNAMIHRGFGPSDWAAFILTGQSMSRE